jgi:hypothetical protein
LYWLFARIDRGNKRKKKNGEGLTSIGYIAPPKQPQAKQISRNLTNPNNLYFLQKTFFPGVQQSLQQLHVLTRQGDAPVGGRRIERGGAHLGPKKGIGRSKKTANDKQDGTNEMAYKPFVALGCRWMV